MIAKEARGDTQSWFGKGFGEVDTNNEVRGWYETRLERGWYYPQTALSCHEKYCQKRDNTSHFVGGTEVSTACYTRRNGILVARQESQTDLRRQSPDCS